MLRKITSILLIMVMVISNSIVFASGGTQAVWTTDAQGRKIMLDGNGNPFGYGENKKVIDLSQFNNNGNPIDWNNIRNAGIDGAILRASSCNSGGPYEDKQFGNNVNGAKSVGIPFGVYCFSYAQNASDAQTEANFLLGVLNKNNVRPSTLGYPVYLDLEDGGGQRNLPTSTLEEIATTFINTMAQSGYKTQIYSNIDWFNNIIKTPTLQQYVSWVAAWMNSDVLNYKNNYNQGLLGWQYTNSGTIPGISNAVDFSVFSNYYGFDTQNNTNLTTGKSPSEPSLEYAAYNKNVGWLPYFTELNTAGTTGRGLDLYQLKINLRNAPTSAQLSASIYSNGQWTNYNPIDGNTIIGQVGNPIQKVNFSLTNVAGYKLYYRVHSSFVGWQDWVPQGNEAGIVDGNLPNTNIQAIEFKLVPDSSVVVIGPKIYYSGHVQYAGWQPTAHDSQIAGTTGQSRRLEALTIGIDNVPNYNLNVTTFVQNEGWQTYNNVTPSTVIGSLGKGQEIRAISMGVSNIPGYTLQYRAHIAFRGWTDWVGNSQVLGDENGGKFEAIELRMVPAVPITSVNLDKTNVSISKYTGTKLNASVYPLNTTDPLAIAWTSSDNNIASVDSNGNVIGNSVGTTTITATSNNGKSVSSTVTVTPAVPIVQYESHVQNVGWQDYVSNGAVSGTSGRSLRLEAIKINLANNDLGGGIQYQTHVQNKGWQDWKTNDELAGTSGESLREEAIRIQLTGPIADSYDVYYQVHAAYIGWMPWVKNGEMAGTSGESRRLEAIRVVLMPKGQLPPASM